APLAAEHKICGVPAFGVDSLFFHLVLLMPLQHTHTFRRERDRAVRVLRFAAGAVPLPNLAGNPQLALYQVDIFPAQAEQLTLAQPAANGEMIERQERVRGSGAMSALIKSSNASTSGGGSGWRNAWCR